MKKILIFLLAALTVCLMLGGCAGQTATDERAEPSAAASQQLSLVVSETPSPDVEEPSSDTSEDSEAATMAEESAEPSPIYADQLEDGTYTIEVSSSSSMFKIVDAQLTVADGEMTAVLTLSGDGYEKLYMGTGEQALEDTEDTYVYFVENDEGMYTYEVPVAALDQDLDCAAWSFRKEKWYDRVLVFQSALISEDAFIVQ